MPETPTADRPVVVVGAGWAGLSAAVELCIRGIPVRLLESARQPGGRARSVRHGETVVDNGQHLVLGACQSLLTLLERIGVDHRQAFLRLPLRLYMRGFGGTALHLRAPPLPAPIHLLGALAGARGLTIQERLQALYFGRIIRETNIAADEDISVLALLHSAAQPAPLIRRLWQPLCLAALNTPVDEASARVFLRVAKEAFFDHRHHSDMLVPKTELGKLLPRPAVDYLESHGGRLELGQRVTSLELDGSGVRAVTTTDRRIATGHVILATPHLISRRLLSRHAELQQTCAKLARLGHEPVTTLYLQYPQRIRLPHPVIGLENSSAHWLFDRRVCAQPGLMAAVTSARGPHMRLPPQRLISRIGSEIATCFPRWPAPDDTFLVREKRATFHCGTGIDARRPGNGTPVPGLWLAGDYTVDALPATLESAVRSGINGANAVAASLR